MRTCCSLAGNLLRADEQVLETDLSFKAVGPFVLMLVLCSFFYGAVMGSYGGFRLLQVIYSGIKVPVLLLVTFFISLPSFFVLNTLLGVRKAFGRVLRMLLFTQAAVALVLAAMAPYTVLWHRSTTTYTGTILFNAFMFAAASIAGHTVALRFYRPLVEHDRRHGFLLRIWVIIYAFVGIQMGYVLRPFIGDPSLPTQFFREGSWGNAYVVVARLVVQTFGR